MIKTTFLTLLIISFISCNTTDGGLSPKLYSEYFAEDPYIIGKITNISTRYIGEEPYIAVLVEENPNVHEPLEKGGKKISFFLSETTEIFIKRSDGSLNPYDKEKLKVSQKVEGWTMGVVMDSYPLQGGAKRMVVIDK